MENNHQHGFLLMNKELDGDFVLWETSKLGRGQSYRRRQTLLNTSLTFPDGEIFSGQETSRMIPDQREIPHPHECFERRLAEA